MISLEGNHPPPYLPLVTEVLRISIIPPCWTMAELSARPFFCAECRYIRRMDFTLRSVHVSDLPGLSALCLRSKAHWGYNATFMAACRDELTIHPNALTATRLIMAEVQGQPAAVAQLGRDGDGADLLLLYVDPPAMGHGIGRALFDWCVAQARAMAAPRLLIEADPNAAPFYERMGARRFGSVPSGSIPGRHLPHLALTLR